MTISFATLFFGLVWGVVPVEVRAPAEVERVELRLDGRPVAEVKAPFSSSVDLGPEPAPHELVAVARDARGRELGLARQWINRPSGPSPGPTAVPVVVKAGASLPPAEALRGWFQKDGAALDVASVGEGGFDVVFVYERSAIGVVRQAFERRPAPSRSKGREDLRIRFLLPAGAASAGKTEVSETFETTRWLRRRWDAIGATAAKGLELDPPRAADQRIADAVAVAGLLAAGEERRRAVVLLLGPGAEDGSSLPPDAVGRFLAALRVPLRVWSIGTASSAEAEVWSATTAIATAQQLDDAVDSLRAELRRQRIVRIEGSHLPQAVTLSPLAREIELAH